MQCHSLILAQGGATVKVLQALTIDIDLQEESSSGN